MSIEEIKALAIEPTALPRSHLSVSSIKLAGICERGHWNRVDGKSSLPESANITGRRQWGIEMTDEVNGLEYPTVATPGTDSPQPDRGGTFQPTLLERRTRYRTAARPNKATVAKAPRRVRKTKWPSDGQGLKKA